MALDRDKRPWVLTPRGEVVFGVLTLGGVIALMVVLLVLVGVPSS